METNKEAMLATAAAPTHPSPDAVLSSAVLKASGLLGISQALLAKILGVSPATVSRLAAGSYRLSPSRQKEWDFAVLFVRVFRSLDALVGHGESARQWLAGYNAALNAKPVDLLASTEGIVRVLNYLDACRGRV